MIILRYDLDPEVLEYRNSAIFRDSSNFWLVNTRTPYKEILHLLPNHYLDFCQGSAVRFWPRKDCISSLAVNEGVRRSVPIIIDTIKTACKKFDIKMGITAGIDSRITLAATKDFIDRIYYFTIEDEKSGINSIDLKIPSKLLPKLGIKHHVLKRLPMSDDFRRFHDANAALARKDTGKVSFSLYCHFDADFTILNSNVSETSQYKYWLPKAHINGEGLAIITGRYHPLAIDEYNKWIKGAKNACEASDINILELLYWEQKMGRWATSSFSEYDLVHDTFTPYNNRLLQAYLLGINERMRRDRMWHIPLKMMKYMWPEVLSEPIQPGENFKGHLLRFIRRRIIHKFITPWFPIYEYTKYLVFKKRIERRV